MIGRGPAVVVLAGVLGACGGDDGDSDSDAVIDPGDGGEYSVEIDPASFASAVDNPYYPLAPGMQWRYEETGNEGEIEITTVEVLTETRVVMGVDTTVVHDVVTSEDGTVIEDTYDWFAQDAAGRGVVLR